MTQTTSHACATPFRHHLVALCCLALLAACDFDGGGGNGDGSDTVVAAAPALSQQPVDVQVVAGGSAQFSVSASGDGLAFQWQRSTDGGSTWAAVAGATGSSFSTGALTQADDGQLFRVVVSNAASSTVSAAARLQVSAVASAPAVTAAPASQQAVAGGSASFAVTASGTDLAYRWQLSTDGGATWADIAGAVAPTLQLSDLPASADGQFVRAVVSNSAGSVTTEAVRLTVQASGGEPVIGTQPAAVSVVAPQAATFTVAAGGQPAPSYQWQRSSDGGGTWADIAGATAASYSTGATSLGDNGLQLRVRVSNSVGSVTSEARQLSVSAAASAPAIGDQPQDVSVAAGQLVTLGASVSGTPTPTLQWQLSTDGGATWTNINGATAGSYSFTASAGDDGRRYRLVATNSAGTSASRGAVLTVTANALAGRSWATARSLEENATATAVTAQASTIDDAGRVTTVFIKSDGSRDRVYAVRGTPGAAGEAPVWTAPAAIDNGPLMVADRYLSVASAPGGDVVAVWTGQGPCTADTYLTGCSYVQYVYMARYSVATGTWSAPLAVTDTPTLVLSSPAWLQGVQTWMNDRGDLVLLLQSWVPGASVGSTNRYVPVPAIFMRAAAETGFRRQILAESSTSPFEDVKLDMDDAGNLLMGTKLRRNGIADIVAYRGTVVAGLGQPVSLEDRTDNAVLAHAKAGRNGQQVVAWYFLNSDLNAYAATSANPTDAFDVRVIDDAWPGNGLVVTDAGQAIVYSIGGDMDKRLTWTAQGGWVERRTAQRTGSSFMTPRDTAVSRNGLVLYVDGFGETIAYDLSAGGPEITAQSPASRRWVLGFGNSTVGYAKPVMSVSGIGFAGMLNGFATLPTAGTAGVRHPSDSSGTATNALWGAFLK